MAWQTTLVVMVVHAEHRERVRRREYIRSYLKGYRPTYTEHCLGIAMAKDYVEPDVKVKYDSVGFRAGDFVHYTDKTAVPTPIFNPVKKVEHTWLIKTLQFIIWILRIK